MILEDVIYSRGNGKCWKPGNLRLDCDGTMSLLREDPIFTHMKEILNIKQCSPYLQIGSETDQIPGKPIVPCDYHPSLVLYLPNMKNPQKSLWILFKTADQMRYWLDHIYSVSFKGCCPY